MSAWFKSLSVAAVVTFAVLACSSGTTPQRPDAGPLPFDAGPSPYLCDARYQTGCSTGVSCMYVDAGLASACLKGNCDLVRQTGCTVDQKCVYLMDGGFSARGCAINGTADAGEACSVTGTQCLRGLTCVQSSGAASGSGACQRFCYADQDCPSGTECGDIFLLPPGTSESPSFCIVPPQACDILSTAGCPAQDACYSGPRRPSCYPQGSTPIGGRCTFANDCVPGSLCTGTGADAKCRQLCRFPDGGPSCTSGGVCTQASIVGEGNVGVCL